MAIVMEMVIWTVLLVMMTEISVVMARSLMIVMVMLI